MTLPGRRVIGWALIALPLAVAVVFAGLALGESDDDSAPAESSLAAEPVAASEATYASLGSLVAASDAVIEGAVVEVVDGRPISDPTDPEAGIRTRLASVDVETLLAGDAPSSIVIEQEAALLDGTPIEVNGVPAFAEGQRGIYFVVAGGTEEFPYHALVNRQARYDLVDGQLVATGDDELSSRIEAMSPAELRCAISGNC